MRTMERGNYFWHFDCETFSPRTVLEWLNEIPSSMRKILWEKQRSAIETLFLYAHRNDASQSLVKCQKWTLHRDQEYHPNDFENFSRYFHRIMSI